MLCYVCGDKRRQEQNVTGCQVKKKISRVRSVPSVWLGTWRYTMGKITVYGKALVLEVPDIADLLCALASYMIFL